MDLLLHTDKWNEIIRYLLTFTKEQFCFFFTTDRLNAINVKFQMKRRKLVRQISINSIGYANGKCMYLILFWRFSKNDRTKWKTVLEIVWLKPMNYCCLISVEAEWISIYYTHQIQKWDIQHSCIRTKRTYPRRNNICFLMNEARDLN